MKVKGSVRKGKHIILRCVYLLTMNVVDMTLINEEMNSLSDCLTSPCYSWLQYFPTFPPPLIIIDVRIQLSVCSLCLFSSVNDEAYKII